MAQEFKFDRILIKLVEGLGHPYRYTILESMIDDDKSEFSMKELQVITGLNVTTLGIHLKHLTEHGIIETLSTIGDDNTIRSYKITPLGNDFIKALVSILE